MFIKNKKISSKILASKFTKINLPKSTETVGLGLNSIGDALLLFDIAPFNTDIIFEVEAESEELDDETRYDIIDRGLTICHNCSYFEDQYVYFNEDYYDNLNYEIKQLQGVNALVECIIDLLPSDLKEDIFLNLNNCLSELSSELLNIDHEVPDIAIYEAHDIDEVLEPCTDFRDYIEDNLTDSIHEKLGILEEADYNNNLLLYLKKEDYTNKLKGIKVFEDQQTSIEFLEEEYIPYVRYVHFLDCINHLSSEIIYRIDKIKSALHNLINSIDLPESCPGITRLHRLNDCMDYSTFHIPNELRQAYDVENGNYESYNDDPEEISGDITINLPAHYYSFNLNTKVVYMFADIKVCADNSLLLYPFYFPNVYGDGSICFKDNASTISTMWDYGKFTHILEVFWGSSFNHDLTDIGFQDLGGNTNTQKYQNDLETALINIFNVDHEEKHYINTDSPSRYIKSDWHWFDISIYDFYLYNAQHNRTLLVIEKSTNIIHNVLRYAY